MKFVKMSSINSFFVLIIIIIFNEVQSDSECIKRYFGFDSFVCVCNSTYCDTPPTVGVIPTGQFVWFASNRDSLRMSKSYGYINNVVQSFSYSNFSKIKIDHKIRYQKMKGWGGSATDAAGLNIMSLSPKATDLLIKSYFSKTGIEYNLIRTTVGGSDMSTRPYTLDDTPDDFSLEHFSLQYEDYNYKIPLIQRAIALNPEVRIVACVWSCPPWMKANDAINGPNGTLLPQFYQTYADYYMKFLNAYKQYGIDIWMMSPANEPLSAKLHYEINNIMWSLNDSARWVVENMGPTLSASEFKTKIYAIDDLKLYLEDYIDSLYALPEVRKHIICIGVHWYSDFVVKAVSLDITHEAFPDQFLLMTEASTSFLPSVHVRLGSWIKAQIMLVKVFENVNNWVTGWIDWNLALNEIGGPSYVNNTLDAAIIVNAENDEFYKQPLFYVLGHFSKFVPRNSVRISATNFVSLNTTAFETPDNQTVVQIYNSKNSNQQVFILDDENNLISLGLTPKSINTIIYRRK